MPLRPRARSRAAGGHRQRGPAPAGVPGYRRQRPGGDGERWNAADPLAPAAGGDRGGVRGRGAGDFRRDPGADLRPVLHDEAPGAGDRAGAGDRPGHRDRSRRAHRGDLARRQGGDLSRGGAGMKRALRVLGAHDGKKLRELVVRELARKGHDAEGVADGEAALARLGESAYDVVVLDMKMPRKAGIEVLRDLAGLAESPQIIVMTGFQEVATAVEAMKLGAYDYLTKPTRIEELDVLIRKAAEKGQLLRDNVALRAPWPGAQPSSGILPGNARMQGVLSIAERVAPPDSSVLVLGESGTGRSWSRAPSTSAPRGPTAPSCPSTAAPCPARCWSRSCSATRRARSRAPSPPSPASSSWRTAARSCWTRSGRSSRTARSSCCARWRRAPSSGSAAPGHAGSTCGSSPRPIVTSPRRCGPATSGKISTTGSTPSPCSCRRCASGARTCRCSPGTSWRRTPPTAPSGSAPPRWRASKPARGRATFGNCSTRSSAP